MSSTRSCSMISPFERRHGAAGHHEPEAGPVRRRDRLPEGRVAGPVAVDAGDEGGRRRDRRALLERPARARLAVGHREPRLDLALAEGVEALDLEPPRRVGVRLREAPLRDDLPHGQLVVQDVEERDGTAAGVQHLRRHAGRLRADADVHGPAQLRDQHGGVGALPVRHRTEGVAEHEQVLRPAAAPRHEPARHRVHGVALAGEADVDVADVARDGRVRDAGLTAQLARQLHALVQAAGETGVAQARLDLSLQLADRGPRRLRPAGDEVDGLPVQVVLHQCDLEPRGGQPAPGGPRPSRPAAPPRVTRPHAARAGAARPGRRRRSPSRARDRGRGGPPRRDAPAAARPRPRRRRC